MRSISAFLTRRIELKANETKSAVARTGERKFLGFSIGGGREAKRRIAPKALARCKQRIRELTRRRRGISRKRRVEDLAAYLRGWKSYFGFRETPSTLQRLDQWIRRRLRSVIWKQQRRRSCWRTAGTAVAQDAFPTAYLDTLGLRACSMGNSTRPNRRMRTRIYGGVAGASG